MRSFTRKILFFILISVAPAVVASAQAQVTALNVGVVDVQSVLQKSAAGKHIQKQLDKKRAEYQKQISEKEVALRAAEKAILKEKDSLSEDEFNAKRKKFESDVLAAQKLVQANKRSLEVGFSRGLSKLRDEIRGTIEAVAKERGYAMVLSQETVLIAAQSMDMTGAVIKALDDKISEIPIDWSIN